MTETNAPTGHWSIGELATACGVTVRALHHYDEIGLLSASRRTASGHRRYTGQDVRRLYRIRTLQMLGLPLADIGAALESPADDLTSLRILLEGQLLHVRRHAEQVRAGTERRSAMDCRAADRRGLPAPGQDAALTGRVGASRLAASILRMKPPLVSD